LIIRKSVSSHAHALLGKLGMLDWVQSAPIPNLLEEQF
jgi:hypothetical protein